MNIIHRFNDLDHLTSYMAISVTNEKMIHLTPENIQEYAETFSMNPSLIHDVQNNTDQLIKYYLYPGSKTNYRKTIHSFIPNVLYKKIYNAFRINGYIREANGTHVIACIKPITAEVYNEISSSSDLDNQKVLNQLIDNFSNVSADNQYFLDYIKNLETKYSLILSENQDLKDQIYNSKLSNWY